MDTSDNSTDIKSFDLNGQLLAAAANGELDKVKKLISEGADANAEDEDKDTPLMRAAYFARTEVVLFLLPFLKRYQVNAKNFYGQTALLNAINISTKGKNKAIVEALIAAGAELSFGETFSWTPLMHAALNGDAEIVSVLIPHLYAAIINKSVYGDTALTLAAKRGHQNVVAQLQTALNLPNFTVPKVFAPAKSSTTLLDDLQPKPVCFVSPPKKKTKKAGDLLENNAPDKHEYPKRSTRFKGSYKV